VPVTEKELRVRGTLIGVDVDNGSYDIRVRPWHRRDGDHGAFTVQTTAETSFEIGDGIYTGTAGLEALAALDPGVLTVAFGTLDFEDHSFSAAVVHAGDSVEGERLDAVQGNIVARSDNLLTVKGAFASRRGHRARPYRTVTVEVGPDTRVYMDAVVDSALSEQDLSVGQRIVAFGNFIESDPEAVDSEPVLDAKQGSVRMNTTRLHGTVTSILPGQINMELRAIDRLGVEMFDFSGTGMNDTSNADPTDYEILTGNLSLNALSVGKAAEVLGFVAPFGFASPDFTGRTVIGNLLIPSKLGISWTQPGTAAPFTSMGLDGLVVDLGNPEIGERHHIWVGRELVDLTTLTSAPTIAPSAGRTLFSLWESGHVELFNDFAAFLDELTLRLNDGATIRSLYASGSFDELANSVEAQHIVILTEPAISSDQ